MRSKKEIQKRLAEVKKDVEWWHKGKGNLFPSLITNRQSELESKIRTVEWILNESGKKV